jgi:protein TonB
MRYEGVVLVHVIVDKTGRITAPRIFHALGLGLDENALATMRQWKFTPGMRDGQPVNVAMDVEVNYHLYDKK